MLIKQQGSTELTISIETVQAISEMARAGASNIEIIETLGVSNSTIQRHWPADVRRGSGPRRGKIDVELIQQLSNEGKTVNEIVGITGYSLRTVRRHRPEELKNPKRVPKAKPGWEQREFFVHPEVVEAKEALIKTFMDNGDWGVPRARLEHLLGKHHPMAERPTEQMEHTRIEKLKKFVFGA